MCSRARTYGPPSPDPRTKQFFSPPARCDGASASKIAARKRPSQQDTAPGSETPSSTAAEAASSRGSTVVANTPGASARRPPELYERHPSFRAVEVLSLWVEARVLGAGRCSWGLRATKEPQVESPGRLGAEHGAKRDRETWTQKREREAKKLGCATQPYTLVIGGGQDGIALGAHLRPRELNVRNVTVSHSRAANRARSRGTERSGTSRESGPSWAKHPRRTSQTNSADATPECCPPATSPATLASAECLCGPSTQITAT